MVDMSDIEITSMKRTCIACPATWYGRTFDGGEWYVRIRGGVFSFRYADSGTDKDNYVPSEYEIYRDEGLDNLQGHMDPYEVKDKLMDLGVKFQDVLPSEFYGSIRPKDCDFILVGDWFDRASCADCEFTIDDDSVERLQYETVVPKSCPECSGEIEVRTSEPERVKEWG